MGDEAPNYMPAADVQEFEVVARTDGAAAVHWRTTYELGVTGFRVVRQTKGGAPEPVGSGRVRACRDGAGGRYDLVDSLVRSGDTVRYELFLLSRSSPATSVASWAGVVRPFAPVVSAASATVPAPAGAPLSLSDPPHPLWIGTYPRIRKWTNNVPADRVRLSLREEGVYGVSVQELADAMGVDSAAIADAMARTNLCLSCQGASVAWCPDGTNLLFYGMPTTSRFAPENVYWVSLTNGTSSVMGRQAATPESPQTTNQMFEEHIALVGTNFLGRDTYSSLADLPAPFTGFGELGDGDDPLTIAVPLLDCVDGAWNGTVTVNLLSYYDLGTDDHSARISVGGVTVCEPAWSNEQYRAFSGPFSSASLSPDSRASLAIENTSTVHENYPYFACLAYRFSYARRYRARDGWLRCTGGSNNTVAVSGFASNDLLVWDVSAVNQPRVIDPVAATRDAGATDWTAAFSCGGTDRVYAVFSKTAGVRQPAVRGVRDVDWSSPSNTVEYAILIPPEAWCSGFRTTMQILADFRSAQGLRSLVVDVESLYNRYSFGLVDPLAIRAFCGDGYTNGAVHRLRYVLLAGAGALDYTHAAFSVTDRTACLIPTVVGGQRYTNGDGMLVGLDEALGDVTGDAAPEVAIGRFPTTATQDLAVAVQKTMAYEGALLWKRQASVAADWDNTGVAYYPFSAGTDRLIAPLAASGRSVVKHYPFPSDPSNMVRVRTNSLLPALQSGSGIFHYFGHSNEYLLGGGNTTSAKLLFYYTITTNNWQKPMIAFVMGCNVNRWQWLYPGEASIVPYGLFATNTGFVAGLGPTGYLLSSENENLGVALHADAATNGTLRLGDVLLGGLRRMAATNMPAERLQCFCLTGDPALVFRSDVTSTGTSVSWLSHYGLTVPNADLADPDHDGWPTYKEYQAGTNPIDPQSVPRRGLTIYIL